MDSYELELLQDLERQLADGDLTPRSTSVSATAAFTAAVNRLADSGQIVLCSIVTQWRGRHGHYSTVQARLTELGRRSLAEAAQRSLQSPPAETPRHNRSDSAA